MIIDKDSIIGDILDTDIGAAQFFIEEGMHCFGCPASRGETIEEACMVHNVNSEKLIKKLNEYFSSK